MTELTYKNSKFADAPQRRLGNGTLADEMKKQGYSFTRRFGDTYGLHFGTWYNEAKEMFAIDFNCHYRVCIIWLDSWGDMLECLTKLAPLAFGVYNRGN